MDARGEHRRADELARLLERTTTPVTDPTTSDDVGGSVDDELAEMLVLASSLREIESPAPRAEFRAELRDLLLREAQETSLTPVTPPATPPSWPERLWERAIEVWRSGAVATASIVGAVALLGVGIVAASEHAQPGDLLYGVKQASEQLRLTLATDEAEFGQLHLQLAERRLDEVAAGAATESSSELRDGLARMDRHTAVGASILLEIHHEQGEIAVARDLRAFTERQRSLLESTMDRLPVSVIPFAEDSLDLLDRIDAELDGLVLHGCVPCADLPDGPLGESGTDRCCPSLDRTPAEVSTPTRDVDRGAEAEAPADPDAPADDARHFDDLPASSPGTSVSDDVADVTDDLGDATDDLRDLLEETNDELDEIIDGVREDLGGLLGD